MILSRLSLSAFLALATLSACSGSSASTTIDPNASDEKLFQEGLALYNQMMFGPAAAKFDQLLSTYPSSPRHDNAGYLTGRCAYELVDYPTAITKLVAMRTAHPDSLYLHSAAYFTGRSRFELATYATATPDFRAAVAADPAGTFADNAQYYVGRSLYEAGDLTGARPELAAVETDYATSSYVDNARYYLGRTFFDAGDFTGALAPLERVFMTTGSSYADDAQFFIGRAHYGMGGVSLDTALTDFETLVSTYAGSQYLDNAVGYEARIYADKVDCVTARQKFTELQTSYPGSVEIAPTDAYLIGKGC